MSMSRKMYRKQKRQGKQRKQGKKNLVGGQSQGYAPGGPLTPGIPNGLMENKFYDSCMSVNRPGQLTYSATGGVPGLSGMPGLRGGAYTNNLAAPIAGFPQIDKIPCAQRGGVGAMAAKDMGVYEAHTARYTTEPSQWVGGTGSPVLLNKPLDGAMWSKSCSQTAGSRRRRNYTRTTRGKKGKKAKKSRKSRC